MSQLNKSVELMKGRPSTGRLSKVNNSRNKENPVVDISNKPTALGSMSSTPSNLDIIRGNRSSRFTPMGGISSRSFEKGHAPIKKTKENLFVKQPSRIKIKQSLNNC